MERHAALVWSVSRRSGAGRGMLPNHTLMASNKSRRYNEPRIRVVCGRNLDGARIVTDPTATNVRQTLAYHERTKHHLHRYAPGPDHLDWATQPDPFRTFAGAPAIELPL